MQKSQREAELTRELEKQKENKQVEEILRLEKEIEDLQRMKERQELSLTEASLQKLQQLRDEELRRLEDEACRAAQEFLESLNFDEIDECVRNIERSLSVGSGSVGVRADLAEGACGEKPSFNFSQPYPEEEVDEGFEADDDAFKDSPNPSEHGHSDQRTSGIRTSDESSEEDPYMNDTVVPTSPDPDSTVLLAPSEHDSSSGEPTYCMPQTPGGLPSPDGDYNYDQDDYEDGAVTSGSSVTFSNSYSSQWSPDYRCSVGTYNSSGAYRFSSEGAQSSVSIRCPPGAPICPHCGGSCLPSLPPLHYPLDEDIPPRTGQDSKVRLLRLALNPSLLPKAIVTQVSGTWCLLEVERKTQNCVLPKA